MFESQGGFSESGESLVRRCNTDTSWSLDRRQSKTRTCLRRSTQDEPRPEERNEGRLSLECLDYRFRQRPVVLLQQSSWRRLGSIFPRVHREYGASLPRRVPASRSLHEPFSSRSRLLRLLAMLKVVRFPRTLSR